ncbi:Rid family hydrolase, partial [Sulfitobacter sp.]|uniref:Rid family hydrolase n=1 Tax=Sulfitobacter sp. TaxID=1903071 RepID=UPI003001653E
MTLKRLNPGPRMSQAVCIGDIAFLAGQVPDDLGADITEQTKQVFAKLDAVVNELSAAISTGRRNTLVFSQ